MNESGEQQPPPAQVPAVAGPPGNPWERRGTLGLADGFIQTLKLFITAPTEGFAQTLKKGDFGSPLLFAIIVGWIGVAVGQVWEVLMGASVLSMMPAEMRSYVPFVSGSTAGFLMTIIFAPVYIIIGLFIWSAIMHLCLVIVGGLNKSVAGFEGSFRVISYSAVAQLANLIPVFGWLISFVWSLVLAVIGVQQVHETPTGKAVAAVLIPVVLCCACMGMMVALFGVGLAAMFANQ